MPTDPIRIRITPREQVQASPDRRAAFWAVVRAGSDSETSVESYEAKLTREFGPELRQALVNQLSEPLRTLDSELFPRSMLDFERWVLRFMDRPERYGYQFADAFARLIEHRQQVLRENPALRQVQDQLAAAGGVMFAARIAGYSSLNLELSTGSFKQIAKAFEDDFDSFRVFLDAFVPVAFAGVFSEAQSDRFDFTVSVPTSVEQAFRSGVREAAEHATTPTAAVPSTATARERAEWLWRLANGSLLVPVLLALIVMYMGMKMLSEISGAQYEAMRPALEHQLKLLEEDRHRFLRDAEQPQEAPAQVPATTPTK